MTHFSRRLGDSSTGLNLTPQTMATFRFLLPLWRRRLTAIATVYPPRVRTALNQCQVVQRTLPGVLSRVTSVTELDATVHSITSGVIWAIATPS